MGSTQVGFKVCGSELRRSKDHKGKKVQNFKIQKSSYLKRWFHWTGNRNPSSLLLFFLYSLNLFRFTGKFDG